MFELFLEKYLGPRITREFITGASMVVLFASFFGTVAFAVALALVVGRPH